MKAISGKKNGIIKNQHQNIKGNASMWIQQGQRELNRLVTLMNLDRTCFKLFFDKFVKVRQIFREGTKFRDPIRLVPLVMYFTLHFRGIKMNREELLSHARIPRREFDAFELQILSYHARHGGS